MTRFSILLSVLFLSVAAMGSNARAENSSLIKVDLDVNSTVLVRADLDQLGWYYHIDKTACVCWVGAKSSVDAAPSVFDCRRLKAHAKLAEHVKHCTAEPSAGGASAAEEPAPEAKK